MEVKFAMSTQTYPVKVDSQLDSQISRVFGW